MWCSTRIYYIRGTCVSIFRAPALFPLLPTDNLSNRYIKIFTPTCSPSKPHSDPPSFDEFYSSCDPDRPNLCLYGHNNGTWEVALPIEEVPPEMPEPALGLNFAREGMKARGSSIGVSLAISFLFWRWFIISNVSEMPLCIEYKIEIEIIRPTTPPSLPILSKTTKPYIPLLPSSASTEARLVGLLRRSLGRVAAGRRLLQRGEVRSPGPRPAVPAHQRPALRLRGRQRTRPGGRRGRGAR